MRGTGAACCQRHHGLQYGQYWPCRHFPYNLSLATRMSYPQRPYSSGDLSRHNQAPYGGTRATGSQ
jgi:hypothetical protein